MGGWQHYGAEHPADVRTLQPPQHRLVDKVKEVRSLERVSTLPSPSKLPHIVEVLVPLGTSTTLGSCPYGTYACRLSDDMSVSQPSGFPLVQREDVSLRIRHPVFRYVGVGK